MSANYTKTTWVNDAAPAVDADHLNHLEAGIEAVDLAAIAAIAAVNTALGGKATPADISAAIGALTAGSPAQLDTFLEVYNKFLADESTLAALTTTVAGKMPNTKSAVIATGVAATDLGGLDAATAASTYLPVWKPNAAYLTGQRIVNPSGRVVTANADFTSGATYSASNWTEVGGAVHSLATAATPIRQTQVTGDAVPRFTQGADGRMQWADGTNDTAPRRAGFFFEKRELFDFGIGTPFSQGNYYFMVLGDPDDPIGVNQETGQSGTNVVHGYCLHVQGFTQLDNSLSVFSRTQPYIVVGRMGIDTRFPTQRPAGYGEEVALGIVRLGGDYFTNSVAGDTAIRAYGPGVGVTPTRYRRINLGSNDGSLGSGTSQGSYARWAMSVGGDDVQLGLPLNLTGQNLSLAGSSALPASADGFLYLKVAGVRVKVPYFAEPVQVIDGFGRPTQNPTSLAGAETGQIWNTISGRVVVGSGQANASALGSQTTPFACTVIPTAADHTIAADITPGTLHRAELAFRNDGARVDVAGSNVTNGNGNTLLARVDSATGTASIVRKYTNSYATLASAACTWPQDTTHRLSVSMSGNTATLKVDGTTVVTFTLTGSDIGAFAANLNAGPMTYDTTTKYDNLTISTP